MTSCARDLVAVALLIVTAGCAGAGSDAGVSDGGVMDADDSAVDVGAPDTAIVDAGATPLPCDVDAVLEAHCRRCHGRPPTNFAPMAMVTWEDTQAPAPDNPSAPIWQVMQGNITAMPPTMPPAPDAPLSDADTATLLTWIDVGTPPGASACAAP